MREECGVCPAKPVKPIPRALGPMNEPLEFAACPASDIEIDPFERWTHLRPVEVAVIDNPTSNDGIVHLREVLQGSVAAVMQRPAPDFPADARQRLRAGGGLEAVREDPLLPFQPHRFPGTELKAQKVKRDDRKVAAPVHILAVDDLRL